MKIVICYPCVILVSHNEGVGDQYQGHLDQEFSIFVVGFLRMKHPSGVFVSLSMKHHSHNTRGLTRDSLSSSTTDYWLRLQLVRYQRGQKMAYWGMVQFCRGQRAVLASRDEGVGGCTGKTGRVFPPSSRSYSKQGIYQWYPSGSRPRIMGTTPGAIPRPARAFETEVLHLPCARAADETSFGDDELDLGARPRAQCRVALVRPVTKLPFLGQCLWNRGYLFRKLLCQSRTSFCQPISGQKPSPACSTGVIDDGPIVQRQERSGG
ncbi:hypothetical protein BDZ89DRAFT_173179 [Hymenopellis radicata]|nr:hypothetical protein BDZ89DRAFT_173179 [Hymenopellis radicata]